MTTIFLPFKPRPEDPAGHMVVQSNLEWLLNLLNKNGFITGEVGTPVPGTLLAESSALIDDITIDTNFVTILSVPSFTYDGSRVRIETSVVITPVGGVTRYTIWLMRDSDMIGSMFVTGSVGVGVYHPLPAWFDTPTDVAHTYSMKVHVDIDTATCIAGGGYGDTPWEPPASLKIYKV